MAECGLILDNVYLMLVCNFAILVPLGVYAEIVLVHDPNSRPVLDVCSMRLVVGWKDAEKAIHIFVAHALGWWWWW